MILIRLVFLCFVLIATIQSMAQTWSGPVNITAVPGNSYPDLTVDRSGTLWCVFAQEIVYEKFWKVFAARSTDQGLTWTGYTNISQNTTHQICYPHIAADTAGRLHVTYDYYIENYTQTAIHYTMYDGAAWSLPVSLSDGMPGSDYNKLTVDRLNRIFCFWDYGAIRYRVKTGNQWGPVTTPFASSPDYYFLWQVIADRDNVLHCLGFHRYYGQPSPQTRLIYWTVNGNQWNGFTEVSDTTVGDGSMALKNNGTPVFTYIDSWNDTLKTHYDAYFIDHVGSGTTEKELISEDATAPSLAVDADNRIYLVLCEKKAAHLYELVCYTRTGSAWERTIIAQNSHRFWGNKLLRADPYLYLVTTRQTDATLPYGDILLFKLKTITGTHDSQKEKIQVYPNPASTKLTIAGLSANEIVSFRLFDARGKDVSNRLHPDRTIMSGKTSLKSSTLAIDPVIPGLYFLEVVTKTNRFTEKLLICKTLP